MRHAVREKEHATYLAPVHCLVRCVASAVSRATWLLFTGAPVRCVALLVRCPGPLCSCSSVCSRGLLCCVCGVLGHLAPVHRCARSVCCVVCGVSGVTWLLFTGVSAWCVVLCVGCPWPFDSCSPLCPLGALRCVCGVQGHLDPVHRCARSVRCFACAVSWATWLLFIGVLAWFVMLCVGCPRPLGSCSPVRPLGVLCCVCGVLGHLAPVHRCARLVRCVVSAVFRDTWLLFTGAPVRCVVLCVGCPWPFDSCSLLCPLGALLCLCGVLGHLAPVHRCACVVCRVACGVSWATWLLFTGAPARCVVLCVRCPGPLGSCSPVCPLGALRCVCGVQGLLGSCSPVRPFGVLCCVWGVLGPLTPVHRRAHPVRCVASAVSRATWILFTGAPVRCVALLVRCPGPLGSCSSVCLRGLSCCVWGVLGHLAPVHRCARSVCCVVCEVSWATWLLFTGAPVRCVALLVRCPGPLGSCSSVCLRGLLCCVWGVLGHLAPVHRCARSVCCVVCAVSWATWLLFTGVPAWCVALCLRCSGTLGSCSPVRPFGVLCCVWGVLGHLTPVHCCAHLVRCFACAVSSATWLLFIGVLAWFVVLRVGCPGPLGSCSSVCLRGVLCCVCGVLGHLARVHRCARLVRCVVSAVFRATWLLFTGAPVRCVVLCVGCPWPFDSCSPPCPPGALRSVCGVQGHLDPVHRCACSVRCFACAVSWATWLLFIGVLAWFVVLRVGCPRPLGSCSPVRPLGVLCCV